MDANALAQVLRQFQESNQRFVVEALAQNKAALENVISGSRNSSSVPSFGKFNPDNDKWSIYQFQMELHFKANFVTSEDIKRSYFLSWVGSEVLELVQKLFNGKAEEKTYKDIISALDEHFIKKQHILAARFKFYNQMKMKTNQNYADWVADLRGAARDCHFICGNENCRESYVDNQIRDMIVLYTPHDKVRTACLQKSNPTLEEVLQNCSIFEATMRASNEIENKEDLQGEVYAVRRPLNVRSFPQKNLFTKSLQSCPGCGKSHDRINCYHFKNKTKCNKCLKLGHISKVFNSQNIDQEGKHQIVRQVHDSSIEETAISQIEEIDTLNINNVSSMNVSMIEVMVNNKKFTFQMDTGASCSLVGLKVYMILIKP